MPDEPLGQANKENGSRTDPDSKKRFRIGLHKTFDQGLLQRVEAVFHGENLLQTILHAHLLLERGLTLLICSKLKRADVLEGGIFGRWSFHQKVALYVGLYDPPDEQVQLLVGFNRLRNALAHGFQDEEECVAKFLPWKGESPRPVADKHVWVVALNLFFDLGIVKRIERLDGASGGR